MPMDKKGSHRRRDEETTCEVCGNPSPQLFKRYMEGTIVMTCYECKELGEEPPEERKKALFQQQQSSSRPNMQNFFPTSQSASRPVGPKPSKGDKKPDQFETFKVKDDAPAQLLKIRSSLNLTPDKFAESVSLKRNYYARMEKGEVAIPLNVAQRIEKKYSIQLLEKELTEEDVDYRKFLKKDKMSTEGMVYFRKRGQAPEYDQDLTKKEQ
jgi:ribosome-binding protein aMBF1 (putative translation factor)